MRAKARGKRPAIDPARMAAAMAHARETITAVMAHAPAVIERYLAPFRMAADDAGVPFADVLAALKDPSLTPEGIMDRLRDLADERREADAERWRASVAKLRAGRRTQARAQRAHTRGAGWAREVDARRQGVTREQVYRQIERRERLQTGTVKKAVLRWRRANRKA